MELTTERKSVFDAPEKDFLLKPSLLLETLSALKPHEVMLFIKENCAPGSNVYEQYKQQYEAMVKRVVLLIEKEEEFEYTDLEHQYAACYALITHNIKTLEYCATAVSYLEECYPDSHLSQSLNWIFTLCCASESPTLMRHLLKQINKSIPCYMNYSGLNLKDLGLLKDVNFSNSTCRHLYINDLVLKNCDFSNVNGENSVILNITGEGCTFTNAICEQMQFLSVDDVSTKEKAQKTFDRLHKFLSNSKGRDTLKAAILKDIFKNINYLSEYQLKKEVAQVLLENPLVAEHRSSILRFMSVSKTNSQKLVMNQFGISDEPKVSEEDFNSNYESESGPSLLETFMEYMKGDSEESSVSAWFYSLEAPRINLSWFKRKGSDEYREYNYLESSSVDYEANKYESSSTCNQQ